MLAGPPLAECGKYGNPARQRQRVVIIIRWPQPVPPSTSLPGTTAARRARSTRSAVRSRGKRPTTATGARPTPTLTTKSCRTRRRQRSVGTNGYAYNAPTAHVTVLSAQGTYAFFVYDVTAKVIVSIVYVNAGQSFSIGVYQDPYHTQASYQFNVNTSTAAYIYLPNVSTNDTYVVYVDVDVGQYVLRLRHAEFDARARIRRARMPTGAAKLTDLQSSQLAGYRGAERPALADVVPQQRLSGRHVLGRRLRQDGGPNGRAGSGFADRLPAVRLPALRDAGTGSVARRAGDAVGTFIRVGQRERSIDGRHRCNGSQSSRRHVSHDRDAIPTGKSSTFERPTRSRARARW